MSGTRPRDPYEEEQNRLLQIYNELTSSESEPDPFADDEGEFGSDKDYKPSSESSNSDSSTPESTVDGVDPLNVTEPEVELSEIHDMDDGGSEWEDTTEPIPEFHFDDTHEGIKVNLGPDSMPLAVFRSLFTPHIIEYITECSNRYGLSLTNSSRPKTRHSRSATFHPITVEEMETFLGLCLLQGHISTSNVRIYFSYVDILYHHPIFPYVMSGKRFEKILRVFCCSDENSKKDKVQPLIDLLLASFQDDYGPKKELSIDESLLHFRGRLGFRVYIKNKKDRYGIKFFELTTSDGYLLNMEMYSGRTDNKDRLESKTDTIIMNLMKPFLHKGHELYMDNYYNSVRLSQKLLSFKTHTTGTLRANRRGNPKNVTKRKLKKANTFG
nr:unnamed protein product [Callosobruchus chinensis]